MSTPVIVILDDARTNKFMVATTRILRSALPRIVERTLHYNPGNLEVRSALEPRRLTAITRSAVNTHNQPFWSAVADSRDVRVIDDRWMAVSADSRFCVVITLTAQLTQWQVTIAVHKYPEFSGRAVGNSHHATLWSTGGAYFQQDDLLRDAWGRPDDGGFPINIQNLRGRLTQTQYVDILLSGPDVDTMWQTFKWNIDVRLVTDPDRIPRHPRYVA